MLDILAPTSREALADLARGRGLLAFDFDGTLAPIVDDRDAAAMMPSTAAAFREVCKLYPSAVVSGRSRDDVAKRLLDATPRYVLGNHGIEGGPLEYAALGRLRVIVLAARTIMEPIVASLAGVEIEDKFHTLSLHYRNAAFPSAARLALVAAAAGCPGIRVVDGKAVVNLVPTGAPHKGDALVHLRAHSGADKVLFVGDDVTDEDAFALGVPWLVSVRIGASASSLATYVIPRQAGIDELLERLVALRS